MYFKQANPFHSSSSILPQRGSPLTPSSLTVLFLWCAVLRAVVLCALQAVLAASPSAAEALATKEALQVLVLCLRHAGRLPGGAKEQVQELAVAVLLQLAGNAGCCGAMTGGPGESAGLVLTLLLLLSSAPPIR